MANGLKKNFGQKQMEIRFQTFPAKEISYVQEGIRGWGGALIVCINSEKISRPNREGDIEN